MTVISVKASMNKSPFCAFPRLVKYLTFDHAKDTHETAIVSSKIIYVYLDTKILADPYLQSFKNRGSNFRAHKTQHILKYKPVYCN